MQSVVVTGGAGFIGCNFVRTVLKRTEARVVVLDKLTYAGSLHNLEDVLTHPRFVFVKGDITDGVVVESILNKHHPDCVINFAAETHVDRSIDDPRPFVITNVLGTSELLEMTRMYWKSLQPSNRAKFRFVQVSTDEVYGALGDTVYSLKQPLILLIRLMLLQKHRQTTLPGLITNLMDCQSPFQIAPTILDLISFQKSYSR